MEYVYFVAYFLIINIIGFVMMYSDKQKAKKDQYRTREKSFFVVSLLLGGIGTYIGMYNMLLDKGSDEVYGFKPDKTTGTDVF